jgi:group I intron endonuclease
MTYIYTLSDENEIRYIGKTKFLNKRNYSHIHESNHKKTYKEKWINSVLSNGGKIIMEVLDVCNDEESNSVETYWISQFKTWGFRLTNLTDGGDGGSPMLGKKHTNETKLKMSEFAKNQNRNIGGWNKGLKMSDEFREKISQISKSRIIDDKTKQKISKSSMGKKKKPMSDETKLKISEKKKGSISPNKGNKYSEEIKKQMSLSRIGIKRNNDVKKILSECKKIIWKIKNPNGEILEFFGYNSFKKYVIDNSLNVSVTTLRAYGKNKGWIVIDKIKQK